MAHPPSRVRVRLRPLVACACRRFNHTHTVARLLQSPPDGDVPVTVNGFIRSIRKQKTRCFASIGDGSSLEPLQALLTPLQAEKLSNGTAVRLAGTVKPSPNAAKQSHELLVQAVDILGLSDAATFPLQKKYQTPDYLRSIPHLRSRLPVNSMLLRFRSDAISKLTRFFAENDYTQTHPPVLTSSDCEGAGEVFGITTEGEKVVQGDKPSDADLFFRSPKYLTVSSQLHLEALAQSVGRVWTLAPTFRAEKSDTSRHLSEFYMLEAEASFVDSMTEVMDLTENMLRYLATSLSERPIYEEIMLSRRRKQDAMDDDTETHVTDEELAVRWDGMKKLNWPRITYTEAIELLQQRPDGPAFEHQPSWGGGLQAEHERYLAEVVGNGSPVFVTHYPASIKPFYMLPTADADPARQTVDCFDLLVPSSCEIVGGSMREHRLEELLSSMQRHGLVGRARGGEDGAGGEVDDLGGLQWYVDLRRWGSVPHGGFGLGFDRLLCYLAGVNNIRDTVAFPRWAGRCDC